MKQLFIVAGLLFFLSAPAQSKKKSTETKPVKTTQPTAGRNIPITLTPYKNCWIYLGSYYGKTKVLADSTWLNEKSEGVFKGDEKLTGGIYFIVSPSKTLIEFELLMDEEQHFSIKADTSKRDKPIITGSLDNDLFVAYSKVSAEKGRHMQGLKTALANATTKEDSLSLKDEYIKTEKELQAYRENIIKKYPNSLLTLLFNVMNRPEAPAIPIIDGKPDSAYPYRYVKEHFWDNVNFYDNRILRTPMFFDSKIDDYYKYYVSPEADSIIPEIKYMLLSARTGKEIFPYLLIKFTNKYVKPEYMGQDKVFLYLFNEYYTKGDTIYLDAASRKMIFERAYSLIANQIGEPAPPIKLTDTLGVTKSLYDINANYTLIVFWDPHCGHCKHEIPRIDSMYQAKWKDLGMKIYAIYVYNDNIPDWKKFITEHHLTEWTHVYQTKEARDEEIKNNVAGYKQLYDARVTPTLYLLDNNKQIIAKQLTIEQFDNIITEKNKKK
ncbi:MAG: redoxin domain-containing protein [Chitinophagaceae bacterium]|nr:redoxin domain-containing protein [Chitinophagaceae bacterium]MCW5904137.1 redoxin domain-containing protein [Chitinophagaceae bacterium]